MRVAAPLLSLLVLALANPAFADRLDGPTETEPAPLPLRAEREHLVLQTLREAQLPVIQEDSTTSSPELDEVEGTASGEAVEQDEEAVRKEWAESPPGSMFAGPAPWRFFDGAFAEGGCRDPRLSEDGYAALAICSGLDPRNPRHEHVVMRRGHGIFKYDRPVAPGVGAVADLSADGERFAVLVEEGGARTVHLVDLAERLDWRMSGGWREPGNPEVADEADAVAFVAKVGGKDAAVLARLGEGDEQGAWRAWTGGKSLRVLDVTATGDRVLLTVKDIDLQALFLVDPIRGLRFNLSGRKGDVADADIHRAGEAAVFTSSVGGVCAVWWVDMTTRRRKDLFSSVEGCYDGVAMDRSRRLVLYEEKKGTSRPAALWDRKARGLRGTLPSGCSAIVISGDGRYYAGRCVGDERGSGVYLFPVPEEEKR